MARKSTSVTPASAGSEPLVADMYERWTLDCVVELVQCLSKDFVSRPPQYRNVTAQSQRVLQDFLFRSGTDPNFPDLAKRQLILVPLVGPSDGSVGDKRSQFHSDSGALRERARAFTERQVQTGEDNLRQAFFDEVVTFRSYLETLIANAVVVNGYRQTSNIFDRAAEVLLDGAVTSAFGQAPASVVDWPRAGSFDQNGARVIEEVAKALKVTGPYSHSQFIIIQRIGHFGAETIRAVIGTNIKALGDVDPIIKVAYSWKTAIDSLGM